MVTVGDYFRRQSQRRFARIILVSIGVGIADWMFGLAAFLGLGAGYFLALIWESNSQFHNRMFAPVAMVMLAFGPVTWAFELLLSFSGSQLIDRGNTTMALAMGGIVAMIGFGAGMALFVARKKKNSGDTAK